MGRNRLQINAVLFTRDGRHFGNAIVTGHDPDSRFPWQFTTDYGNTGGELSTADIHKYFRVGPVADTDHKHYVWENPVGQNRKARRGGGLR